MFVGSHYIHYEYLNFSIFSSFKFLKSIESYTDTIKTCIDNTKHQIVILVDSLDEALHLNSLDWLPTKLPEQVKIIITTTSSISRIDDCNDAKEMVLWSLKGKISKGNFVHLTQFSDQQWNEVLSYGGGDFYTANVQLELPEAWKSCALKIPLQAKVRLAHKINDRKHYKFLNIIFCVFETVILVVGMAG